MFTVRLGFLLGQGLFIHVFVEHHTDKERICPLHFFFQTFPFYNPNPAAFFMSRVLCVSQQQSNIYEEII